MSVCALPRFVTAVVLLLAPTTLVAQVGHCTKPETQGILFLGTSLYRASGGFDAAGRPNSFGPGASFTRAQLGAYIEYGATNDITLITNISAVHLRSASATSTKVSTGFNNPELGAAFAIDRVKGLNKLFCAFNTMVKLPIRGGGDPIIGFEQMDVEFGLRSLGNLRIGLPGGYWVSDIAYRTRFGAPADELRYNANATVRVALHWYVVALAQTTTGMRNGRPTQIGANYILNPDYSSYSAQLTTMYRATRTRMVQFGVNRELAGRNSGAGTTAIMTIWQYF